MNGVTKWFQDFLGRKPRASEHLEIDVRGPIEALAIGQLDALMYRVEGTEEPFFHRFGKRSRPLLLVSLDGKQIFVAQGRYRFTERGFVG